MSRKKKPPYKWLRIDAAALAACLLLTASFHFIGFKPLLDRTAAQAAREDELARMQREADQLTATLATLQSQLAGTRQAAQQNRVQLQPVTHQSRRMIDVNHLAVSSGLEVDEVHPGNPTRAAYYQTVPIQLAGTGSYRDCAAFLHRLGRTFPDTGIASFEVTGRPQSPGAPAKFRFALTWYAMP